MVSETVEAEGHLIDSGNFQSILTTIVEHGSEYEILRFAIGRKNEESSHLTLELKADTDDRLRRRDGRRFAGEACRLEGR